ncbi:magnesium transporter [Infundibulicybe gibba]|nr:magnesium transporter [Infundibulicybe gibba]
MPRENSFTDSEGRSLTPDLEDEMENDVFGLDGARPVSPTFSQHSHPPVVVVEPSAATVAMHALRSASRQSRRVESRATNRAPPAVVSTTTPLERFRRAVRKIMAMHRGTSLLAGTAGMAGAEPGVDPRRASADAAYGHIHQDCVIEVVDYSAVRSSFGRMTNREFVNLMGDHKASEREPWVKARWINIGGMSWDVIKAVSLRYDLHPLALEDIFHTRSQTRSKADYYPRHLFLRILCHELGEDEGFELAGSSAASGSTLTGGPRSSSPLPMDEKRGSPGLEDDPTVYGSPPMSRQSTSKHRRRGPILPHNMNDLDAMLGKADTGSKSALAGLIKQQGAAAAEREKQAEAQVSLEALKKGERVPVNVSPMYIFLFRDGTVISIHPKPDLNLTAPITRRLHQRDTGLRTSADASLLVHALLDLIVDKALEVIDEYHTKINKFERAILLKPQMKTPDTVTVHILSGDLILHKRTMEPIKTLIYGLRRYDLDRCAALVDTSDPSKANIKIVGFMSHKSKIYCMHGFICPPLADVFDHMEYILTSLDMFAGIAENLINYTFNLASYEMNEAPTDTATIIFLPLTLLTGYFGMNFDNMWTIHHGHTDVVFWAIALPVMAIVLPIFILPDLKRILHYIQKKMATKKAVKTYKQA